MNQSTKVLTLVTALASAVVILAQLPYVVYSQNESISSNSNSSGIGGVTDDCERDTTIPKCVEKIISNSTGQNTTDTQASP